MKENLTIGQNERFLIVGCEHQVIGNLGDIDPGKYRLCDNLLDGVAAVTQEEFDAICIMISCFESRSESAISAIRKVNRTARIILLAQMYEEPLARRLISEKGASRDGVDDYLICPVDIQIVDGKSKTADSNILSSDVSSLVGYNSARIRELERLATEDDLTGLKNRRYVREFVRQIIARDKGGSFQLTVLLFDIDDLKKYNDSYGHSVGDTVLRQTAAVMRRCFRDHDVVARIGGDEFAVVFWDLPGKSYYKHSGTESERRRAHADHPHEALFMAERFCREISSSDHPSLGAEGKGLLTISGGLASFPRDAKDVEGLFEQADKAMFEAKRSGKNRVYLVGQPETD